MIRTARLKAYAKLNLGLRVLYKRPDNFHELRTVFQTISLADRLEVRFERRSRTRIEIQQCPEIPDNLVERAARLVLEELSIHADLTFILNKHIPAGAGLGGGSSDAAAVLLSLPVLAGKVIAPARLSALAGVLGSDVPFFLHGGTVLGLGRGEELYPLPDRPRTRALLVAPSVHSSTAEAYRDLSGQLTSNALQNTLDSFQQEVWAGGSFGLHNDFEDVVFARHPALAHLKRRMLKAGADRAAMTGSGSAIFGLFGNGKRLEKAKAEFAAEKVFGISFVSRSQYRGLWRRSLKSHIKSESPDNDLWPPRSLYAR